MVDPPSTPRSGSGPGQFCSLLSTHAHNPGHVVTLGVY